MHPPLQPLITGALAEHSLLLAAHKHRQLRREAFVLGRGLLPRALSGYGASDLIAATRSLGWGDTVPARLLGFGWQQTEGLAALAGTSRSSREGVARLGALFNLGIVLFDYICDRSPDRARVLLAHMSPASLDAYLAGSDGAPASSGDGAVDLLITLIGEFFSGVRVMARAGSESDRHGFVQLIRTMYRAERFATDEQRGGVRPSRHVWRELRHKSSLPMATLAQIALLSVPNADPTRRAATRAAAALAGDAIWIIDDLADIREDWESGHWSRPLWLLARRSRSEPTHLGDLLHSLAESGILAAEARRLAARLFRLRRLTEEYDGALMGSVQATIHAWLEEMPG